MTAEELLQLSGGGPRCELVAGELRLMEPAGWSHGIVSANASAILHSRVDRDLGWVFGAETGFVLARNPDTVRAPDSAFVAREHGDRLRDGAAYVEGPPDLAVEVVSPGYRPGEIAEKVSAWLEAGCRLVLVADPRSRTVTAHRPDGERAHDGDDLVDCADGAPGMAFAASDLFA